MRAHTAPSSPTPKPLATRHLHRTTAPAPAPALTAPTAPPSSPAMSNNQARPAQCATPPLGVPDLERSLIVGPTPWNAHITAYKQQAAGTFTTPQGQTTLLERGADAYVALEQVYIAQRAEIERVAAENEALRRMHGEAADTTPMPLHK
jgi:hypothetical protein